MEYNEEAKDVLEKAMAMGSEEMQVLKEICTIINRIDHRLEQINDKLNGIG